MRVINALLVIGLVAFTSAKGPHLHRSAIRWYASDKAVTILKTDKRGGGSGSHVIAPSGKTYILTNKHVCNLADKDDMLLVKSSNDNLDRFYRRKVVARYEKHDLCIIEPVFKGQSGLKLGSAVSKGQTVGVLGHPRLAPLSLFMGEIIGNVTIEMVSKAIPRQRNKQMSIKDILDKIGKKNGKLELIPNGGIIIESKAPKKRKPSLEDLSKKYCAPGERFMKARGWSSLFYEGLCLKKFETTMYTAVTRPGSSGSPVLDFWGNIIGVTFAGNPQAPTESFMVPLKYVRDFLYDK